MEDWNRIRKSDDEFIKEIYERAGSYQQQTEKDSTSPSQHRFNSHKLTAGILTAAATIAIAIVGAVKLLPQRDNQNASQMPESAMYRSVEEDEVDVQMEEAIPEEATVLEVLGQVLKVEESDKETILLIKVDEQDKNELASEIEVVVSEKFYEELLAYEADDDITELIGLHVIIYVEKYNWLEYFKLNQEDNFYFQTTDEDGQIIYRNLDGDLLND